MPKISYIAKEKSGYDDTTVTALQIEQKIADIQALLRGMIDEENLIGYDDIDDKIPFPPSNVFDMPIETRPVQHCMKFFGRTANHTTGIVEKLHAETVDLVEKNPEFRFAGGIGDQEIIVIVEADKYSEVTPETKKAEFEIPSYWSPVTCEEIWNIVKEVNPFIGIEADQSKSGVYLMTTKEVTTIEEFEYLIGFKRSEIVFEPVFEFPPMLNYIQMGKPTLDEKNIINISLSVEPKDVSGYTCRYSTSVLCRVNP